MIGGDDGVRVASLQWMTMVHVQSFGVVVATLCGSGGYGTLGNVFSRCMFRDGIWEVACCVGWVYRINPCWCS